MKKVGIEILLVLIVLSLMSFCYIKGELILALIMFFSLLILLIILYVSICGLETANDIFQIIIKKYDDLKKLEKTDVIDEKIVEELLADMRNLLVVIKSEGIYSHLSQRQKRKLNSIENEIDGY